MPIAIVMKLVTPQNSHVVILTPNVMVLEVRSLGGDLVMKVGPLKIELEKRSTEFLCSFNHVEMH